MQGLTLNDAAWLSCCTWARSHPLSAGSSYSQKHGDETCISSISLPLRLISNRAYQVIIDACRNLITGLWLSSNRKHPIKRTLSKVIHVHLLWLWTSVSLTKPTTINPITPPQSSAVCGSVVRQPRVDEGRGGAASSTPPPSSQRDVEQPWSWHSSTGNLSSSSSSHYTSASAPKTSLSVTLSS